MLAFHLVLNQDGEIVSSFSLQSPVHSSNLVYTTELGPEVINHFESFVTAPVRTAVVRWHHDFLNAVLFYTLAHVLRNPRMFPDYDDSWPIDTYLKMKTLILAKTGGYMHLYCKRAKSEFVTSFHMLLDSYQHVSILFFLTYSFNLT